MANITLTSQLKGNVYINPIEEDVYILIKDITEIDDSFNLLLASECRQMMIPKSVILEIRNVPIIPEELFRLSHITKLIIGEGVHRIECDAFADCKSLCEVDASNAADLEYFSGLSGTGIRELVIPPNVKSIPNLCSHCYSLKKITLNNKLLEISEKAFAFCTSLESVEISDSCEEISAICSSAFEGCGSLRGFYANGIQKMNIVEIFQNLHHISNFAFKYCKSLQMILDAPLITQIDCEAFSFCQNLYNIVRLQNPKLQLGAHVFENTPVATVFISKEAAVDQTAFVNLCIISVKWEEVKKEEDILQKLSNVGGTK